MNRDTLPYNVVCLTASADYGNQVDKAKQEVPSRCQPASHMPEADAFFSLQFSPVVNHRDCRIASTSMAMFFHKRLGLSRPVIDVANIFRRKEKTSRAFSGMSGSVANLSSR